MNISLDDQLMDAIKTKIEEIEIEEIPSVSVYTTRFAMINFDELSIADEVFEQSTPSVWLQLFDRRQERTARTNGSVQDVVYIRVYVFMPGDPASEEVDQQFNFLAQEIMSACRNCKFGSKWIRNDYMQIENGGDKNTIEAREGILIYAFDTVFNFFYTE